MFCWIVFVWRRFLTKNTYKPHWLRVWFSWGLKSGKGTFGTYRGVSLRRTHLTYRNWNPFGLRNAFSVFRGCQQGMSRAGRARSLFTALVLKYPSRRDMTSCPPHHIRYHRYYIFVYLKPATEFNENFAFRFFLPEMFCLAGSVGRKSVVPIVTNTYSACRAHVRTQ